MANLKAFAGIARVPFLLLPVTLVASGAAAAAYDGAFDISRTVVALIGLVALHIAANVLNEWSDMRTGIDLHTNRTPFSGGSGTIPSGAVSTQTALAFGLGWAAIGLATGLWLLTEVGWVLVPIMVLGAVFVLGYTDLLARSGVGEIAAGLGLGGLPVIGTALVQDGTIGPAAVAAAVPATLMTFNLLLLNEFPDTEADRRAGRRTLPIILGGSRASLIYSVLTIAIYLWIIGWVIARVMPAFSLIALLTLPFALKAIKGSRKHQDMAQLVPAMGSNVLVVLVTQLLLGIGYILARII